MNDEAIVIIWGQIAGGRYKEREKKNEPEEAIPTTCTSWGKIIFIYTKTNSSLLVLKRFLGVPTKTDPSCTTSYEGINSIFGV